MLLWILTFLTAFGTLACLYLASNAGAAARRRVTLDRVGRVLGAGASPELVDSILRADGSDLGSMLSGAAKRYKVLRNLELMLYRAGQPMTLGRLLGLSVGATILGVLVGGLLGSSALGAALGALPFLYVRRLKNQRMKTFDAQFPQALALFSRALRAGHSLNSGLQMVGSEMAEPVGPEFAIVAREISLGLPPGTALANLQARLETNDLPVFVTAVLVQLETGGNLAETLDNLAEVIRNRMLFYGKVKALTAQSMMSANILLVMPFAIYLLLRTINPEFMEPMQTTEVGRRFLGGAIVMALSGWWFCRRVARVDV
jgi:tight adherence protein B